MPFAFVAAEKNLCLIVNPRCMTTKLKTYYWKQLLREPLQLGAPGHTVHQLVMPHRQDAVSTILRTNPTMKSLMIVRDPSARFCSACNHTAVLQQLKLWDKDPKVRLSKVISYLKTKPTHRVDAHFLPQTFALCEKDLQVITAVFRCDPLDLALLNATLSSWGCPAMSDSWVLPFPRSSHDVLPEHLNQEQRDFLKTYYVQDYVFMRRRFPT